MITLIEASNYRCLRSISQPLGPFHILVGPNASGKTTFLDIISFLSQLVSHGLDTALNERTRNFSDLTWRGQEDRFELALEARMPEDLQNRFREENRPFDAIRYEVAIGSEKKDGEWEILNERVLLKTAEAHEPEQMSIFPTVREVVPSLLSKGKKNTLTVINKVRGGNDYFSIELKSEKKNKGWQYAFKLGPTKSALGNLPDDQFQFPATTWLRDLLSRGVQPFVLNSLAIRKPSPPAFGQQGPDFRPDGSNLPWVIEDLKQRDPARYTDWLAHIQTALPDIEDIRTIERPEDRHRYLVIKYRGGIEAPSWMVSDGTLRFLALTLPAYLPELKGIYLIEEPENGIHPRAVEAIFQSLSSVYDAQILMATHSPIILGLAEAQQVLCFAKTPEGATDIVSGNRHPALKDWKGETNLGVLFAAGVLG